MKVARPVLRGPGRSNALGLPDKDIAAVPGVKVSADGRGVVSHAGMGLLRELADLTGLSTQLTEVLADTYKGPWT